MNTHEFKVTAGTTNCIINRHDLEERARIAGVTDNQIEILTDAELDRLVMMKELKDY